MKLNPIWIGQERVIEVINDSGTIIATVHPAQGHNAIHIRSQRFHGDPPVVESSQRLGLPGYLILFDP